MVRSPKIEETIISTTMTPTMDFGGMIRCRSMTCASRILQCDAGGGKNTQNLSPSVGGILELHHSPQERAAEKTATGKIFRVT